MKFLLALLLAVSSVQAQQFYTISNLSAITYSSNTFCNATNFNSFSIPTFGATVGVVATGLTTAGTNVNLTFYFQGSMNGTNWWPAAATNSPFFLTLAVSPAGTNIHSATNFSSSQALSFSALRLAGWVSQADLSSATNIVISNVTAGVWYRP